MKKTSPTIASVSSSPKKTKKLPNKIQLLKAVITNPVTTGKVLYGIDKAAVKRGKILTGKNRWGQAAGHLGRSEIAKDLVVNSGGYLGSVAGASIGGPIGQLAGDNLGAVGTRKLTNQVYARHRAKKRLGPGASKEQIAHRQKRYNKALERLDKRKANNLSDQIGWGIGNSSAAALTAVGVNVPLKGGAVAMRTVPSIVDNIKKIRRGELSPRAFLSQTGKDIGAKNNLVKAIREGNKREAEALAKINKRIGTLSSKNTVEATSKTLSKNSAPRTLRAEFNRRRPATLYSNLSYA